jgi:hypothetical protein
MTKLLFAFVSSSIWNVNDWRFSICIMRSRTFVRFSTAIKSTSHWDPSDEQANAVHFELLKYWVYIGALCKKFNRWIEVCFILEKSTWTEALIPIVNE